MERYCKYCKIVQKIYYFAVNASFAVSLLIFALKFNFLKLYKVGIKLVQSCYKLGAEKLQKWYKNIEKHINLLLKTWKKLGKNLEKTWKKLGIVKRLQVNFE